MSTEEVLRDRMSDAVEVVAPRRPIDVTDLARVAERARVRTRRQQSVLGGIGVLVTAAAVALAAVGLPSRHEPKPPPAATPPVVRTSDQLLALVRPAVEKAMAQFHVTDFSVQAGSGLPPSGPDPQVFVSNPAVKPQPSTSSPSPANVFLEPGFSLGITLHTFRQNPGDKVLAQPPSVPTTGTWPGQVRWAKFTYPNANGTTIDVERADNLSIAGQARGSIRSTSSGTTETPNPLGPVFLDLARSVLRGIPSIAPLPLPPAIGWVKGPADALLTQAARAAAKAPDPAAHAQLLYLRGKVVDTALNQNDTEEMWWRRGGQDGAYYAAGILGGRSHYGYSGERISWIGGLTNVPVTWATRSTLPSDPKVLQAWIYRGTADAGFKPAAVFAEIAELVEESPLSPAQQSALALVAARLPGVQVVTHTTDPLGRPAVSMEFRGATAGRLFVSPQTGEFMALAELDAHDKVKQYRALLDVEAVSAIRVRPDGTIPPPAPRPAKK